MKNAKPLLSFLCSCKISNCPYVPSARGLKFLNIYGQISCWYKPVWLKRLQGNYANGHPWGTSFLPVFLRKWTYPRVPSTFLFLVIPVHFLARFGRREAPHVPCENWWPYWGRRRQNPAVSHPNITGNLASWCTQLCLTQTLSRPEEVR